MHSSNRAVLFDTGPEFHQDRMPPPVTIENFFACQANLNGPIEHERGLGHDDLMIKRVALPSETSAFGRGDHANMRFRHIQQLSERASSVLYRWRAQPTLQLTIR